ncbi:PREDICTED: sorting nexin-31 [Nanorana parkeri]|uniref:sorting nexin-31 n=1 Tax=Nanorana parkeri TaxID=125878 RepID=UPI000854DAB7|nr:PREDICTED: sorting nexin-31 [Nanorana parkeri]
MHVNIPVTEELVDDLGGRYVLYSVYLEGFILFKVRYKELHFWDEQMHRIFGNRLPLFPPKYYLMMTKSMAEERRTMLERYLQEIVSDPVVSNSEIFIVYLKKFQLGKMPTVKLIFNVYLPDGNHVKVDGQSSDTAERVLEAALYKLGVSRELKEYFSLFITHKESAGAFTVIKRIAHFEIPFVTIWNIHNESFQIDIRKWYMDPSTDVMLMGCTAAIDLLYCQAVQELEVNWSRPTEEQRQRLQHFTKTDNKVKFLELMQEVEHYGYVVLGPCTANLTEKSGAITVAVGSIKLSCSSENEHFCLPINLITGWHVNMHVQTEKSNSHPFEFKLEYKQGQQRTWITIWTEQAFLLSSCLKKTLSEQPMTSVKESLEIVEKKTSANVFSRKPRQVEVSMKKVPCSSNLEQSNMFESQDLSL